MDAYALAYKLALKIRSEGKLEEFVAGRYASFDADYGKLIEKRKRSASKSWRN